MGISIMENGSRFAEGTINSCHKSWVPPASPDGPPHSSEVPARLTLANTPQDALICA